MFVRELRRIGFLLLAWWVAGTLGRAANDPRPIVGPGASKDDVINAYGWPTGQSQAGTREVLNYPQGQVTLSNGKVDRVDFNPNMPWPAPRPRPGGAVATTKKTVEAPLDFWLTDFAAAAQEATRRKARVLALFTGSDWSPASRQFLDEVAFHPEFVNAFTADFVFLRLDLPNRAPVAPELREQAERLRSRYGVTTYPALLVLTPGGTKVGEVDLGQERPGATYRERVIASVREVRAALLARPPPEEMAAVAKADLPVAAAAEAGRSGLWLSAMEIVLLATAVGLLLAALAVWKLWRGGAATANPAPATAMATRISRAAAGVPEAAEMATWPREKLAAVVAGLAEADGYLALKRPAGADTDLELARDVTAKSSVLVACVPGRAVVPAKRVRELFGSMTVDGVAAGWVVAPGGFATEAQAFAAEKNITLLDAERLAAHLRELPPLLLQKVLTRGA